jgi:acetyl esterase/lipase
MNFSEYRKTIAGIGRAVIPETMFATRDFVATLMEPTPGTDINVVRDLSYGPFDRQRLDIFTARNSADAQRPVLIFVHGGGFLAGDKHTEGSPFYSNIGQWAVRNGFNAVNLTYRLAPASQWPSGIEDLRAAIDFLQAQGTAFGLNPNALFLMGQSAGAAHVASYVAHADLYAPKLPGVRGLILLSGIYNFATMPPSPMEPAYLGDDRSVYPARSSVVGLAQASLPLLVTVSEFDPPQFEEQALELLPACQQQHKQMPRFVHALGQNHLSVALALGLPGDLVGPQIKAFIETHC